jgi:alanine racemase
LIRLTPRLRIEALYTHFANASDPKDPFTERQMAKFRQMSAAISAPLHHLANSAATMRGIVEPGDYVRVGIALFGAEPLDVGSSRLEPVLRWRTEIMRLKELPADHPIGYGLTFRTKRPSRIATLPVGYADGYDRRLSNNADVLVRGRRAPVVGRVSMDLVTIDVTDLAEATFGDEVLLLGGEITAEELAKRTGTISYEVFCRISRRVPRVYR